MRNIICRDYQQPFWKSFSSLSFIKTSEMATVFVSSISVVRFSFIIWNIFCFFFVLFCFFRQSKHFEDITLGYFWNFIKQGIHQLIIETVLTSMAGSPQLRKIEWHDLKPLNGPQHNNDNWHNAIKIKNKDLHIKSWKTGHTNRKLTVTGKCEQCWPGSLQKFTVLNWKNIATKPLLLITVSVATN